MKPPVGPSRLPVAAERRLCLLDIKAVALRLAVSERFVRRLIHQRRIPYIKVGYFVRFDPDDLDVWVSKGRIDEVSGF